MINLLPGQKSSASYNHIDLVVPLQIANGDEPLQQHVEERPRNSQYTSRFSVVVLLEATDTWLDMKIVDSLKSSPYFSVLANECVDTYKHNRTVVDLLSVDCEWKTRGDFLTVLHISALDADAIVCFFESKNLDTHKLIGQGVAIFL